MSDPAANQLDADTLDQDSDCEQRFAVVTPNPITTFVLGSRKDDTGFSGITGTTVRHVFLQGSQQAMDGVSASTATLEAPGQVLVHSTEGSLLQYGKDDTVMAAGANNYLMGHDSVVIAATSKVPSDPGLTLFDQTGNVDDDTPPDAYPKGKLVDTAEHVKTKMNDHYNYIFMPINAAMSAGSLLLGKTADWTSAIVGMTQLGIFGGNMAVGKLTAGKGDAHIFGENTATISSANDVLAIADNTTTVSSGRFSAMFGGIQASLTGGLSAAVTGMLAGVTGMVKAEIVAGKKLVLAARRGMVEVRGKQVSIGSIARSWPQLRTHMVNLQASKEISATVGALGAKSPTDLTLLPDGVRVTGKTHTTTASEKIRQVVGKFTVEMSSSALTVTKGVPSQIDAMMKEAAQTRVDAVAAAETQYWLSRGKGRDKNQETLNEQARTAKATAIKAAEDAFNLQKTAAESAKADMAGLFVTEGGAALQAGLVEAMVKPTGINIDSKGMIITIQCSPTSYIKLTPAGVEIKGLINQN